MFSALHRSGALLLLSGSISWAQNGTSPTSNSNPTLGAGNLAAPVSLLSNKEFWLSSIILVFGTIIIIVEYMLLRSVGTAKNK